MALPDRKRPGAWVQAERAAHAAWAALMRGGPDAATPTHLPGARMGARGGIRHSPLGASVVLSEAEQPDRDGIDGRPPLRRVPALGPGLPAPAGPPFPEGAAQRCATPRMQRYATP